MIPEPDGRAAYVGVKRPDEAVDRPPPPGQAPVVQAALAIGVLLMGVQLWLLTVALDLYLAGQVGRLWPLALGSGIIFAGGLLVLGVLGRRPRVRRAPPVDPVGAWRG
jgi:hypothetical protein